MAAQVPVFAWLCCWTGKVTEVNLHWAYDVPPHCSCCVFSHFCGVTLLVEEEASVLWHC